MTVLSDTTTASTLAFALWELAKSPETQMRVRNEILEARLDVLKSTGTDEIPFGYYEKMPLLIALIKVRRSFIMSVDDPEFTLRYKGNTQDASGRVHGCQASDRRRSDSSVTAAQASERKVDHGDPDLKGSEHLDQHPRLQ